MKDLETILVVCDNKIYDWIWTDKGIQFKLDPEEGLKNSWVLNKGMLVCSKETGNVSSNLLLLIVLFRSEMHTLEASVKPTNILMFFCSGWHHGGC